MSGNLIISLDCEGKWGLSNDLTITKKFTNLNLINTYKSLNNFFLNLKIPVTYAFVGSFILNKKEKKNFDCFENLNECYSEPLFNYFKSDEQNKKEGWFVPEVFDIVNHEINEIACHSFSHLRFNKNLDITKIDKELNNCKRVWNLKNIIYKTFIFPYNEIAHLSKIKELGFSGFRDHKFQKKSFFSKFTNLVEEYNVWKKYKYTEKVNKFNLTPIPGGLFFNWRFKFRK